MTAGTIAAAVGWFVLFGATAVLIARSALGDWREGRRDRDGVSLVSAVQQWGLTAVAVAIAVAVPIVLLLNS